MNVIHKPLGDLIPRGNHLTNRLKRNLLAIVRCSKKSFILQSLDEVNKGWKTALDLKLIEFSQQLLSSFSPFHPSAHKR